MKRIFYRRNDEIYADLKALKDMATEFGVKKQEVDVLVGGPSPRGDRPQFSRQLIHVN